MNACAHVGTPIKHGTNVTGAITTGSTTVFVKDGGGSGGLGVARVGDTATCSISGHSPSTITTGSSVVSVDGQPCARTGDTLSCGAIIDTGEMSCQIS